MSGEASGTGAVRFGPAVSLSYDGADPSHIEIVLPCLSQFDLRATFYAHETGLLESPKAWQAAHNEGHEIGSHSLLEAADVGGNLPKWTLENVEADLRQARKLVTELFPRQADFSFAYPGPDTVCMTVPYDPAPTSYRPVVEGLFQVARSAIEGLIDPARADVRYLESVDARGLTADDLLVAAEAAMHDRRWAIFSFGPIGAGEGAVDVKAHEALCAWLSEKRDRFRTGPVFEQAMQLREMREAVEGKYSWSLSQGIAGED